MIQSNNPAAYAVPSSDKLLTTEQEDRILQQAHDILRRRIQRESGSLSNPNLVGELLCTRIGGKPVESLGLLLLDNQHQLIALEELFTGSANACSISTPHVIRRCVHYNATSVILYHNHPSGITEPSKADCNLTENLVAALKPLEIAVLDHIIVGGDNYESLRKTSEYLFY